MAGITKTVDIHGMTTTDAKKRLEQVIKTAPQNGSR